MLGICLGRHFTLWLNHDVSLNLSFLNSWLGVSLASSDPPMNCLVLYFHRGRVDYSLQVGKEAWVMKGWASPAWPLQLPPGQLNKCWPSVGWQRLKPEPLCIAGTILDQLGSGEHLHSRSQACRVNVYSRIVMLMVTPVPAASLSLILLCSLVACWGVSRQFWGWKLSTPSALCFEAHIYDGILNCRSWRREEPALDEVVRQESDGGEELWCPHSLS